MQAYNLPNRREEEQQIAAAVKAKIAVSVSLSAADHRGCSPTRPPGLESNDRLLMMRPPQAAVETEQNYRQVLVYTLFVVAYMVALYLQASAYDTGEVVATLRTLLLPGKQLLEYCVCCWGGNFTVGGWILPAMSCRHN